MPPVEPDEPLVPVELLPLLAEPELLELELLAAVLPLELVDELELPSILPLEPLLLDELDAPELELLALSPMTHTPSARSQVPLVQSASRVHARPGSTKRMQPLTERTIATLASNLTFMKPQKR